MKKKQQAIFLPVFVDEQGKETYNSVRFEKTEVDGKSQVNIVPNSMGTDRYGDPLFRPMNRAARKAKLAQIRRWERKHGPKSLAKSDTE